MPIGHSLFAAAGWIARRWTLAPSTHPPSRRGFRRPVLILAPGTRSCHDRPAAPPGDPVVASARDALAGRNH